MKHINFLQRRFEAILEELEVLSDGIEFVRIGDAPLADNELPVKVILMVAPDQLSWDEGMSLVQRCRSEMQVLGIDDVHCEFFKRRLRRPIAYRRALCRISPDRIPVRGNIYALLPKGSSARLPKECVRDWR